MKISIITPSYNQAEFIERTIQSVLYQDCDQIELEYVVMDGGSSDQTINILKRYQDQLIWRSESDNGQSHAVNKGLKIITGDIIGWLNSDDIYLPQTLKQVSQFFNQYPDIDVVYGDACFIDKQDRRIGYYPTEAWNLHRLKTHCFISQPATFFRRRVLAKHGLLDESLQYCMDYTYWLRLGLRGATFVHLPKMLAATRLYAEAKSSYCCVGASLETIDWLKNELGYIPHKWFVSHSGASIKATSNLSYPHPRFMLAVWLNLWNTVGLYHSGIRRIGVWISAQHAMIGEFLKRAISHVKKKIKYN